MRKLHHRASLVVTSILGGALALLGSPRVAHAETDVVAGPLIGTTTWTAIGNPYILTGDLTVPVGSSLAIDSGVIVEVANSDTTNGGANTSSVDITIKGALTINGSPTFPVVFGPAVGTDSWPGLALAPGSNTEITSLEIDDASTGIDMGGTSLNVSGITIKRAAFGIIVESGQTFVDRAIITGRAALGNAQASAFSTLGVADGTTLDVGNSVGSGFHYGGFFDGAGITATLTNVTLVTLVTGDNPPLSVRNGATVIMSDSILSAPADFGCTIQAVATPIINLTTSDTFPADSCTGFTAGAGVITVDPKFVSSTDFHLSASSPCIDTAASTSANKHDVEGSVRPVDGNGDGTKTVDMGAYEFQGTATSKDGGTSGKDGGSSSDGGSASSDGGSNGSDAGPNGGGSGDGGCTTSGSTDPSAVSLIGIGIALISMARRRKRQR